MKEFDTYIFDLDGTLLETLNDLTKSTNYALKTHNMPELSINDVRIFVGNGIKKLIERAVPNGLNNPLFEDVFSSFKKHYLKHNLDTTKPYNGIPEVLKELKYKGKNLAVVSNKFYIATQELTKHFFHGTIDIAIGERENIKKKPAPDTVIEALKQLGVSKNNTIYIGDSEVDIMTAKNCGIPCASVLWGFRDKDFLIKNGGNIFINSPKELLP